MVYLFIYKYVFLLLCFFKPQPTQLPIIKINKIPLKLENDLSIPKIL